jgi:hypothetical protein
MDADSIRQFFRGTTLITTCVVTPLCYRAPICDNWFLGWFLGWRALLLGKRWRIG